jgi:pimeloyl-ACP methyl ester carboxylesterase
MGDQPPRQITTRDNVRLAIDVLPPADGQDRAIAAVVVVHGFTAHRRDATVAHVAAAVRDAGYVVVVGDLRGHGDSAGACTLGNDERYDVEAMVVEARRLHDRVVVVGASMGAIAALRYAADDRRLAGVVTVSCPARWQLRTLRSALAAIVTQTGVGRRFLEQRAGVHVAPTRYRAEEPQAVAARVTCPLAIVHGLADRFMPALEASRLRDQGGGPRRLDLVPAMGHAFDHAGRATIVAAISWCLNAA